MVWMEFFERHGRRYAAWSRIAGLAGLQHAFSTRPDDVAMRSDEQAGVRAERRARMAGDLGLDPGRLQCCVQVHGLEVHVARASPARRVEGVDAIVTDAAGLPLMCFSADCPLVLLFDPRRRALGLAHASWRCTVGRILQRVVERMQGEFGSRPGDLWAGIGPSAGPEQYEVRGDVVEAARELPGGAALFPRRGQGMCFDLWNANRLQLEAAGVPAGQIEIAGVCTMTRTDLFYSFRREGAGCGHFGLMAALT